MILGIVSIRFNDYSSFEDFTYYWESLLGSEIDQNFVSNEEELVVNLSEIDFESWKEEILPMIEEYGGTIERHPYY